MSDREILEAAAKAASMVPYNPETGSMKWLPKPAGTKDSARWNSRYANKECGTIDDRGYRRCGLLFSTIEIPVAPVRDRPPLRELVPAVRQAIDAAMNQENGCE